MSSRIHGVVVISGANRGLGLELTKSLLADDNVTKVYAGCRNANNVETLHALYDPQKKLDILEFNITKDWEIKLAFERVESESGYVNVLINNAAILDQDGKAGIGKADRLSWVKHFEVNVVSHAMVIQEFLPLLKKSVEHNDTATIINISGLKGSIKQATDTTSVYGNYAFMCSKAALNKLTRTLSIEHPDVLTASICPGWNQIQMEGSHTLKHPSETAPALLKTINRMTSQHSGGFWDREGSPIPF